ncbi:PD-(D/E)XK nuclease superfamily protein [Parapedobacter composti]|uniref:PD-(D/E)XK nuclease superfamily protein n=1 Tax=Parapedobacter composti TaxID=623281 RepID=A0A1I1GHP7_9SPHI|nr:ATP-binding protein [Parapedobacter composti]SFC09378.1 PD-(D/E)XK nuclease superfamily protein [Parapedobacter composti]
MLRKYPIGLQSFRKIREDGYIYIDKTEIIYQLVTTGVYYFLSRPRRFGKSLLLDTIEELFKGNKALFEGLWIYDKWDWSKTHPVIHFNFADLGVRTEGLEAAIHRGLADNAAQLGIQLSDFSYDQQFKELIVKASTTHGQVVILIDEYDKPLIDYLDDPAKLEAHRSVMKSFYSVLKGQDEHIRLLLLTGVSRFSKVSLFSDLNHLEDITLGRQFNPLVGITQPELERTFAPEIEELRAADPAILETIKHWYNGYTWGGTDTLYNPFSLLNFLKSREFQNYWFQTGTPAFFYDMIRRNPRLEFPSGEVLVGPESLNDLLGHSVAYGGPDSIEPVTILFQTGYLTVKDYDAKTRIYTLDFPNLEVRESMQVFLLSAYSYETSGKVRPNVLRLLQAFRAGDIKQVMTLVDTLFSHIPNTLWAGAKEQFYHAIIQNTFGLLDVMMESDRNYAATRPDITVFTPTHIYVLEFKLDQPAETALNQIIEKDYFRPFQSDGRKKVAIGVRFSSEKKAVEAYLVRDVGP